MGEEVPLETCYGPASIAGAIIGTLLITLALAGGALLLYNIYWRSRKGKHLVLMTDVENPGDQYAFDNPNFREATPVKQSPTPEKSGKLDLSWLGGWSPLQVFSTPRIDKQRSLDDSFLGESQLKLVSLKSHDFTGLGFSVCGNMRDGIFVKDLLHRGPAFESGCINPGDRIDSVCISFRHMVFEDALTILSYASPYEVQVQVQHNATSRPSTLLRKRDTGAPSSGERILHPFYRSQSIADLATIGKNSGKRQNHQGSDRNKPVTTDYTSIKLSPSLHVKKEHATLERRSIDAVDGTDPPKHAKFGIKVLPIGLPTKITKDHSENEQSVASEHDASTENESRDVKAILTKGLLNLKEKINQNTLGRKKKEEPHEQEMQKSEASPDHTSVEIPEEVTRAADAARYNRKSISAESLAARKSAADLPAPSPDSDGSSDIDSHHRGKKKGKAPAPPQVMKVKQTSDETSENAILPASSIEKIVPPSPNIFEPAHVDTDSEVEEMPITCTQATVHHSPCPDEIEPGRKAASLGDLSRLDESSLTGPLERAVSLDLDASHGKKRKAPPPPPEDFPGSLEEAVYRKEPRLEGFDTFQRRLKKSSDFGTMEDAINDSDNDEQASKPLDPSIDLSSLAANNIKEFSSWLEEVRKPQENTLTLNVNGTHEVDDSVEENGNHAWDMSTEELANTSDLLYSSALSSEVTISPDSKDAESADSGFGVSSFPMMDSPTSQESSESDTHSAEVDSNKVVNGEYSSLVVNTSEPSKNDAAPSVTEMVFKTYDTSAGMTQPYNFSVNGLNLQEPSRTVLLISQPNSLSPEDLPGDDETPPQLPTSPPPSASLTYITEIRVSTPENTSTPVKGVKPQRKDISPETSRIPVRTMKSETGQKVLAAIQSLAAKEHGPGSSTLVNKEESTPSVAGYHLKKVPPAVPPRRNDASPVWTEGSTKERVNGTPMHIQIPTGVSLPVKTSATKIVFESQGNNEEF